MRNYAKAFDLLLSLTRELTEQDLELADALRCVTRTAIDMFEGQHASLRILDETGTELLTGARTGAGQTDRPPRFRRGEGVAGWVAETGQVAHIGDPRSDPRFVLVDAQTYTIGSLLAVPLWSAGQVIGCLTVTSEASSYFDENDEVIGRLLANCAVPPIERARLQRIATTDPQTNAMAHRLLAPTLAREMKRARENDHKLSLLLMDLDHFKSVNDSYGHAAGDEVLRAFGELVTSLVRQDDVFIRRGGEEFILLMPRANSEVAATAAERIRGRLAARDIEVPASVVESPSQGIGSVAIAQRVSIGVAEWDGRETAATFEARADAAMYRAKRGGRDRVEVDAD